MPAARKKTNPRDTKQTGGEGQFIEIVNWKKAQPRMKGGGNDWLKLYTSLLDHDGFGGLDDSARMLIVALWLYAARSGLHILPADPEWLARKIPMLNSKPDLEPLLNAADCYGNPTPFVRYCKLPKAGKGGKARSKSKPDKTAGTKVATRARRAQKTRVEESRVEETEEREEPKPLRVSEEEKREKKERVVTSPRRKRKEQTAAAQQTGAEPEKPENPMESEAGPAKAKLYFLPKPARSAIRRSRSRPQRLGEVICEWLPDHWQDPDAESFGWEIVQALGYPDDRLNKESRSEWGAFASWWSKVKKAAPALALDELRAKALQKANYLRLKGKSARNRSKVWFHIMNGELSQRGVTLTQPARASPPRQRQM